jgi:predicted aspartyl protease
MKHLIPILLFAILLAACTSKSNPPTDKSNPLIERQLLQMLENKDIFRLEADLEKEKSEISKSIVLFLEAHLQNAFNQTEQSLKTIDVLLNEYGNSLNDTLFLKTYQLKADNLMKQYQYGESVEAMKTAINNYGHAVDSVEFANMLNYCNIFEPLSTFPPQKMHITTNVTIPISRSRDFDQVLMQVTSNGKSEHFLFDMGAGISIVTESCAKRLGIRVMESSLEAEHVAGEKIQSKVGIADSLYIGDLLVENVAFLVFADDIFGYTLHGAIGAPVMYQMKEIQIHKYESITIPAQPHKRDLHNLFLNGLKMLVQAEADSDTVLLYLDSGYNTSELSERYFMAQQEKLQKKATLKDFKRPTVNGLINTKVYVLENIPFKIGGYEWIIPSINVRLEKLMSYENFDGFVGQNILMHFNTLILNFEDMYLTFEE